jgi:hypothetical protein
MHQRIRRMQVWVDNAFPNRKARPVHPKSGRQCVR